VPSNTIEGFSAGDAIVLQGIDNADAATLVNGNTLLVSGAAGSASLSLSGNYGGETFTAAPVDGGVDALVYVTEDVACFAQGTRIATVAGEVPIEALRVGDLV
jgi:hypothetical protein